MVERAFLSGRVVLHAGDCLEVMAGLPEASIDSCVTDAPYHLQSIQKRFAKVGRTDSTWSRSGPHQRTARGFMNKEWDGGDIAFRVETWAAVFRLLKPGAHLVAFSSTRTYHRMACAIEDAGFEIRDMLQWLYGSGFPKSHNQGDGRGTALKPACEPVVFARKPLIGTVAANLAEHGTGALNIDGCRVETDDSLGGGDQSSVTKAKVEGWDRPWMHDAEAKAAHADRVNANVAKAEVLGRWPANVLHDGSDEVIAAFPEAPGQNGIVTGAEPSTDGRYILGGLAGRHAPRMPRTDVGSAARFFYSAKADADDRIASKHPTVKPVDLMQWLVRLVTPKGGLVLDPFAGTGTTGEAAWREGMRAVLIEREPEYQADIARRMALATEGPDGRRRGIAKAKGVSGEPMPLFGGDAA